MKEDKSCNIDLPNLSSICMYDQCCYNAQSLILSSIRVILVFNRSSKIIIFYYTFLLFLPNKGCDY